MKSEIRIALNELQTNNASDEFDEKAAWLTMAEIRNAGATRNEMEELSRAINKRLRTRISQYLTYSITELQRKYK